MDPAAYHGLAGEVVSTILPHTEADPVALLLQFLVSFGNVVGRNRYYQAEQTPSTTATCSRCWWATPRRRARAPPPTAFAPIFAAADPIWVGDAMKAGMSSGEGMIFHVRDEVTPCARA